MPGRNPHNTSTHRQCYTCKEVLALSPVNFPRNKSRAGGVCNECRKCANRRDRYRRYGVTAQDVELMEVGQNQKCAICDTSLLALPSRKRHVDHCHTSGRVRAMLCHSCNTLLGASKERTETLRRAILYIEEHAIYANN